MGSVGIAGFLLLLSLPDLDHVIGVLKVQLGEILVLLEIGESGKEEWKRVAVLTVMLLSHP